ncbi:MAG: ribonuclease R [Oscillospiraceae bacterium]|nr:ribonuclease R [Oscillospiraceae bacterium]
MAETIDIYKTRIKCILKQHDRKCVPFKELYAKCKGRHASPEKFKAAVAELKADGTIFERRAGFVLCASYGLYSAEVARVNKTFGFLKKQDGTEVFVPGKYLKGAMPNDIVLARPLNSGRNGDSPEGEVVKIIKENFSEFSGTIEKVNGRYYIRPDTLSKELLMITSMRVKAHVGDKVLAEISKRGERHSEHRCRVTGLFGNSAKATSSAMAVLHLNAIETEFPSAVSDEARRIGAMKISQQDIDRRLDLRGKIIFTIDGADTKDIDDAISVSRIEGGYRLGVHIADVSHYVKPGSELDKDAMLRGTSIYYADKVIPMLPKELSNGICSLNPNEDRLAFSCIMDLDSEGKVVKYKFSKTAIRSRVKGVYSEINKILECRDSGEDIPSDIMEKYSGLFDTIYLMAELAEILTARKLRRGAPQIDTPECKLILDENDVCIDVVRKERGRSELIIEEFMLMANTCAAKLAKGSNAPFVYRVHEDPAPEKIAELKEVITRLNIPFPQFTTVKPKHLAEILEKSKGRSCALLVNNMVLRSMAKAKYSDVPLGHFGLVLDDYAHFTSPIRRYPDLSIHRILTDLCYEKLPEKIINKRYTAFAKESSAQSSECEITAMRVERSCEDCYIAEYMTQHLGEKFTGIISSMTDYGFYVELPNTVEGLVRMESLPEGQYDFDGHFTLSRNGKTLYTVGDTVTVICAKADVAAGKIDFVIDDPQTNSSKN